MKRALLLHGTDDSPDKNWIPWAKAQLEDRGYRVDVPQLPDCDVPDRRKYTNFIFDNGLYPSGGLIVGHSSGAVQVMNLLHDNRADGIESAVLIAPWLSLKGAEVLSKDPDKFGPIHGDGVYNWDAMKSKSENILVLHSDDDPYCPYLQGIEIAKNLNGTFIGFSGHRHFTSNPLKSYSETFPDLFEIFEANRIL